MAGTALKRDIGLIGAAFIALNGVIGAGIFVLPQTLAEGAGAASPYLLLGFGALMIFVALVFGELAAHFDQAGGPVVYATHAFGRFAGFQVGWLYYVSRLASSAANANVMLVSAALFLPGIDKGALKIAAIAAVVAVLAAINIAGVKGAARTLNAVTIVKLAPLVLLVVFGLVAFAPHLPPPQAPADASAIGGVSLVLLYAFIGFEMATLTAGETRSAKHALPRALVGTVAGAALFYFLIQLAYVAIMQGVTPEGAPLAAAATILWGPWGGVLMAAAAIISVAGNLFASTIVSPRITFAMAEEGALPRWFGQVSRRFATPVNSIVVVGLIVGALAASGAFVWLAIMSSLARMLIYLVSTAALLKLRRDAPKQQRPLPQTLLRWTAPVVAAGLCVWAATQAKPDAWAVLGAFVLAGTALYALTRWRSRASDPK